MAATAAAQDALLLFRTCIASNLPPIPTTSSDPTSNTDIAELPVATHILFNTTSGATGSSHDALSCDTQTRFISQANGALDLLSVFWCWQNKDKGVGEYISATQTLNAERSKTGLGAVTNLVFAEKLDLVNWLAGDVGENESEFIKSLGDTAESRKAAQDAADLVKGDGDVAMGGVGEGAGGEGERLKVIYSQERKMGDRNTVLRGIKPTVSHINIHFLLQGRSLTELNRTFPTSENTQQLSFPAPQNKPQH